jgi:D-glycero-alpha-D-manno-heptose-7-phosphate kinase
MIISQTPLRVSFFGGGTDLPSFCKKEFGCVISTAIDKYVYLISHDSFDNKYKIAYSKVEHTENLDDIEHKRIREAIKKYGSGKAIEVHSIGEVPAGTGLGASSSYTVGVINALHASQGRYVKKHDLAEQASEIEIDILKEPIGKQDQFAAAYGGMNFIKFNTDGSVDVEPIRLTSENLNKIKDRLITFYLEKVRSASDVLHEQNKNVSSNQEKFESMRKMKHITMEMKDDLNNNKIDRFGEMLHKNWLLKKSLAGSISNEFIEEIYERGIKAGASGGKVLGAGGGGFILFYCEPEKQHYLRKELSNFKEFKFNFDLEGAKIVYLK